MLRSFGVVGALAAAALALVIGIIAFNAHSNDQKNRPFAGGPQSGVADHPVSVVNDDPNNPYSVRYGKTPTVGGTQGGVPAATSGQARNNTRQPATASFGGGTQQPAVVPQARPSCGVVTGLLATLGGLLGGRSSC